MDQIQNSTHWENLIGWAYYDHFLRFLHSIGPEKAAMIRTLVFSGVVIHDDHPSDDDLLRDGLLQSLRLYLPFIMKFCTGLEKLVMYEGNYGDTDEHPEFDEDGNLIITPNSFEMALRPFIENYIWRISTLKQLQVFSNDEDRIVDFAVPTIERVRKRWLQRRDSIADNVAERIRAESLVKEGVYSTQCGFCGEGDHVWAEFHNLCSFCGDYHKRESCWESVVEMTINDNTL